MKDLDWDRWLEWRNSAIERRSRAQARSLVLFPVALFSRAVGLQLAEQVCTSSRTLSDNTLASHTICSIVCLVWVDYSSCTMAHEKYNSATVKHAYAVNVNIQAARMCLFHTHGIAIRQSIVVSISQGVHVVTKPLWIILSYCCCHILADND